MAQSWWRALTEANIGVEHFSHLSRGERETGNAIIRGDNAAVLRLLGTVLHSQVRCIYIDPPYNNQESYTHYRDKLDHETWLRSMVACVELLAPLLRQDGSLWVSIDDSECHYLKVALDSVFGRKSFVTTIVWEQRTTRENRKVFSANHEYILVYARDVSAFKRARNPLPYPAEVESRYRNVDGDPRGPWQSVSANVQAGHGTSGQFYELVAPNGHRHVPPNGRCWIYTKERMQAEIAQNNVWFGHDGNGAPRLKLFKSERRGITPHTLWTSGEVGTSDSAKKHLLQLFPDAPVFDTPKPESLLKRVLEIATEPGDLILDAFLGSGTTAAVAHKMGRKYVGIEEGAHAITHCVERLERVIGSEQGGVSKEVGWIGAGGFDFLDAGTPKESCPVTQQNSLLREPAEVAEDKAQLQLSIV